MKTIFYLKERVIQQLELTYIPRIGELVRFDDEESYFVKGVVYRYNRQCVAIHLKKA